MLSLQFSIFACRVSERMMGCLMHASAFYFGESQTACVAHIFHKSRFEYLRSVSLDTRYMQVLPVLPWLGLDSMLGLQSSAISD